MKKIFIILIMVLSVGACNSPDASTYDDSDIYDQLGDITNEIQTMQINLATLYNFDDTELVNGLEDLNDDILALQERLDNIIVVEGLNGNKQVYENTKTILHTMSNSIIKLQDSFNTSMSAPQYMIDESTGDYISMSELGYLLKEKYFGDNTIHPEELFTMNGNAYFRIMFDNAMEDEEVFARTILLIDELRNYQAYVLSCPGLIISVYKFIDGTPTQFDIKIPLTVLINDYFELTPQVILDEQFETTTKYDSIYFTDLIEEDVITYYNTLKASGQFDDYVLNFN